MTWEQTRIGFMILSIVGMCWVFLCYRWDLKNQQRELELKEDERKLEELKAEYMSKEY